MKRRMWETLFARMDRAYDTRTRVILTFVILTSAFVAIGLPDISAIGIYHSIIISGLLIWLYRSSRKYGFLDTLECIGVSPFVLIAAILAFVDPVKDDNLEYTDARKQLSDRLRFNISEAILETHTATYDHTEDRDEGTYLYFHIPYGLQPPFENVRKKAAEQTGLNDKELVFDTHTPQYVYFFMPFEAVRVYGSRIGPRYHQSLRLFAKRVFLTAPTRSQWKGVF